MASEHPPEQQQQQQQQQQHHQQQPPPPSQERLPAPDQLVMKLTRGHSCVLCQQRKVRCDKQKPCANCVKANVECRVVPPQPPRRRKKKPHERDLIDRLKKYEALLSQAGVNFDPIAHDLKPGDHGDDVADLEQDLSGLKTSPSSAADHVSPGSTHEKHKWFPYYKENRAMDDDMFNDSSDEEYEGPTVHHAFDAIFDNSDGFPFVVGGAPASVSNAHPSAIQIIQLWQIYIGNVNPLLKITHIPTLQKEIVMNGANTNKIAKGLECLMFAIYFSAVTSLTEAEVHSTFSEDRNVLLNKYHNATQQALVNAGFMRSTDLMVLQALLLYLYCIRPYVDPRALFCLIGIAVRIATRLGIHRDGAQFGLPPFEVEQRRRLWWQIVILDKRVAEITGSSITALSTSGGDCRFPLNVNDSDLNQFAKDPPTPVQGPTEMLFSLVRMELTVAAAPGGGTRPFATTPGGRPINTRVQYSPSPSSPDVVTHVANHNLPRDLESFCAYMEACYLSRCDPKIPLHLFALLVTRQALCKLRVIDFLCRGVSSDTLDQHERDGLFMEAIRTVELDNEIQAGETLQGFRWYTYQHFPFPAYIFLVSELRLRGTSDLCERAWNAMILNHERRGMMRNMRTPLHIAFGGFLVKAWDAREAAEAQLGRSVETPKMIAMLRSAHKMKRSTAPGPPVSNNNRGAAPQAPPLQTQPGADSTPQATNMAVSGQAPMYSATPGNTKPQMQQQQQQQQDTPMSNTSASSSVGMDDPMMFTGFDGTTNNIYGSSSMSDVDFGHMDWNYLVQYSSFGGFNPNIYAQQGPPHSHTSSAHGHGHGQHHQGMGTQ